LCVATSSVRGFGGDVRCALLGAIVGAIVGTIFAAKTKYDNM